MHPDLIARTCGSIGVLGALVFVGVLDTPKFIVTPSQNFESVLLSINVVPNKPNNQAEKKPAQEQISEPKGDNTQTHQNQLPTNDTKSEQPPIEPPPIIKKDNSTEVIEVDEPNIIKDEPKLSPKPIKKEEPPKNDTIKEKPSVKTQANSEPKLEKVKNSETKINKTKEIDRAKVAQHTKAQAAKAEKEAREAHEKSLLEASNRKLNAQLASLLVKEIRSKLRYPRNAVRRKLEGTVMVEFIIQNGVVTSYKIEKSSGHKILDEAARKLAKSLVKFNTRLDAMSNRVLIPIKYELL